MDEPQIVQIWRVIFGGTARDQHVVVATPNPEFSKAYEAAKKQWPNRDFQGIVYVGEAYGTFKVS